MQHSYWEIKQYFSQVDYTIIGSGIVGINTALRLRNRFPKAKINILEKGYLPAGASSKNAGFACFGSPSELLSDLKTNAEQEVFDLVSLRLKGLERLIQNCGADLIDYQANGSFEVFTKNESELFEECDNKLVDLNQLLYPIFNKNTFHKSDASIEKFGFDKVEHLIKNQFEGQIDTGKMFTRLIELAAQNNIQIINGVEVEGFEENKTNCIVKLTNGFTYSTQKLFIATNGFANQLIPALKVKPARAQVLITKPIKNLKIKGTFHLEEGYYYFRNIDHRILLGGGRNLAFKDETTTELATTKLIQDKLELLLKTVILPSQNFEVEHRWAGLMGVGTIKKPIIKQLSNSVYCGVRMGGMGIAIGSIVGEQLGNLVD
jgi:glycine/D-amino acid oxidase-like deaminating enzyme